MRILGLLALIVYGLSAPASVQAMQCALLAQARVAFAKQLGQSAVGGGVLANGNRIELWLNLANGSFTIIGIKPMPNGDLACVLSGGGDWEFTPAESKGDPS